MALTVDQITAKNFQKFYTALQPYLNGGSHGGFTPVGSIIAVMGVDAPTNYLKCDGTVYSIEDYPDLANYFEDQLGTKNFFGGNGTTTFAVPDLRGEFLRGTGINSHTNQGDGGDVGEHQDGTKHLDIRALSNRNGFYAGASAATTTETSVQKPDYKASGTVSYRVNASGTAASTATSDAYYTSRPTNTSVLYCIATKNIFLDVSDFGEVVDSNDIREIIESNMPSARQNYLEYSTEEQVIGKWIDGKPLYQKTFPYASTITANTTTLITQIADVTDLNIDLLLNAEGYYFSSGGNQKCTFNNAVVGTISVVAFVSDDKLNVGTKRGSGEVTLSNIVVTIQYTKTTD